MRKCSTTAGPSAPGVMSDGRVAPALKDCKYKSNKVAPCTYCSCDVILGQMTTGINTVLRQSTAGQRKSQKSMPEAMAQLTGDYFHFRALSRLSC